MTDPSPSPDLSGGPGSGDARGLEGDPPTRSGFVALAGRPNVGKSTLTNAIVGGKVAIVSDKPQTTRRAIRGVRTEGDCQIVLVDLPGVQRPRDALTERMAGTVQQELEDSDAVVLVLNAEQGIGPGDRFIAAALAGSGAGDPGVSSGSGSARPPAHVTIAVNKVDRLDRPGTAAVLQQAAELGEELGLDGEIFPVSALTGQGVQALVEHLEAQMPEGPFLFAPEDLTDQPLAVRLGELVREAAIKRTFQEVPHAVEVVVEEIEEMRRESPGRRDGLTRVRAVVWVETESQKAILVGKGGRMVKAIGTAARRELERELDAQVHLDLSVRVRRDWRADEGLLDRLGIT